jgi:Cd2+/Zn2+-exporting ATPase
MQVSLWAVLGSDATIYSASVIQNDQPKGKIPIAIQIGKSEKLYGKGNYACFCAVKVIVLLLGAGGLATLWERCCRCWCRIIGDFKCG